MGQLTAARGPVYYLKRLPIEFTGLSAFHKRPLSGNSPSEDTRCKHPIQKTLEALGDGRLIPILSHLG